MDSSSEQHHHHHQEMSSQTLESMLGCTKSHQERKPRPVDMQAQNCPRCDSTNTKFCYYNNYSLSQPRYFCKSCRRYWTKGGTLRNVPVGGGCRKNKRSSSSSSSSSSSPSSLKRSQDQAMTTTTNPNLISSMTTPLSYDTNDLTLAIARLQNQSESGRHHVSESDNDRDSFSIWGNQNVPHHFQHQHPHQQQHRHDEHVLGNFGLSFPFLENPTMSGGGMQSLYYGMMGNNNGGIGMSGAHETGIPFEDFSGGNTTTSTAVTTVKQETRDGEGRVLWGFPWGDGNGADFETGSRSMNWNNNGINGSSNFNFHGLLNSPLM